MAKRESDQVLGSFIVVRHLTRVLPNNTPIGDPLWNIEERYESATRTTTLEEHNMETKDAQDRVLALVKEMGA